MSDILMIAGIVLIVVAAHKQEKCKKPIFVENWSMCRNRAQGGKRQ